MIRVQEHTQSVSSLVQHQHVHTNETVMNQWRRGTNVVPAPSFSLYVWPCFSLKASRWTRGEATSAELCLDGCAAGCGASRSQTVSCDDVPETNYRQDILTITALHTAQCWGVFKRNKLANMLWCSSIKKERERWQAGADWIKNTHLSSFIWSHHK